MTELAAGGFVMTDREILFSLIASLTLCESEKDVEEAVRKAFELMGVEVEFEALYGLGMRLDERGVRGLWNEEVGD